MTWAEAVRAEMANVPEVESFEVRYVPSTWQDISSIKLIVKRTGGEPEKYSFLAIASSPTSDYERAAKRLIKQVFKHWNNDRFWAVVDAK